MHGRKDGILAGTARLARHCAVGMGFLSAAYVATYSCVVYSPLQPAFVAAEAWLANQLEHLTALRVHAVSGGIALVAALAMCRPFRARMTLGFHRRLGYTYAGCVAISGLTGLALAWSAEGGTPARAGFALLGALWMATTAHGVAAASQDRRVVHLHAMSKSMALAFAAVSLRLQLSILGWLGVSFETAYPIVAWTCWVPNLIWAECRNRHRRDVVSRVHP